MSPKKHRQPGEATSINRRRPASVCSTSCWPGTEVGSRWNLSPCATRRHLSSVLDAGKTSARRHARTTSILSVVSGGAARRRASGRPRSRDAFSANPHPEAPVGVGARHTSDNGGAQRLPCWAAMVSQAPSLPEVLVAGLGAPI